MGRGKLRPMSFTQFTTMRYHIIERIIRKRGRGWHILRIPKTTPWPVRIEELEAGKVHICNNFVRDALGAECGDGEYRVLTLSVTPRAGFELVNLLVQTHKGNSPDAGDAGITNITDMRFDCPECRMGISAIYYGLMCDLAELNLDWKKKRSWNPFRTFDYFTASVYVGVDEINEFRRVSQTINRVVHDPYGKGYNRINRTLYRNVECFTADEETFLSSSYMGYQGGYLCAPFSEITLPKFGIPADARVIDICLSPTPEPGFLPFEIAYLTTNEKRIKTDGTMLDDGNLGGEVRVKNWAEHPYSEYATMYERTQADLIQLNLKWTKLDRSLARYFKLAYTATVYLRITESQTPFTNDRKIGVSVVKEKETNNNQTCRPKPSQY